MEPVCCLVTDSLNQRFPGCYILKRQVQRVGGAILAMHYYEATGEWPPARDTL